MESRIRQALARAEEVGQALADPSVAKDPEKLRSLGREHTRLAPVVRLAERLARLQAAHTAYALASSPMQRTGLNGWLCRRATRAGASS